MSVLYPNNSYFNIPFYDGKEIRRGNSHFFAKHITMGNKFTWVNTKTLYPVWIEGFCTICSIFEHFLSNLLSFLFVFEHFEAGIDICYYMFSEYECTLFVL
jgi:hypothetical protein